VEPGIQLARFLNGSKREAAERVINDAIAANPQSAELRRVKGEMLWSHSDSNAAVRLFDEALKIEPSYQLAHLSRANVNVARGEFKAADADSRSATSGDSRQFYGELPARLGASQATAICRSRSDIGAHQL